MSRADDIRAAALELFTRLGYEATTMADIGAAVGIRGPSLYKHVASKQDLLVQIMIGTMEDLLAAHRAAVASTEGPVERLRRATEAHVRYHARHRLEAFVGNREIRSLVEPHRGRGAGTCARSTKPASARLDRRRRRGGALQCRLHRGWSPTPSSTSAWGSRSGSARTANSPRTTIVWQYTDFALRLAGAKSEG